MKTLVFFIATWFAVSHSFLGKVIKITDGDTIIVITENQQQIKIRLDGIDCPESKQDFGTSAKQAVSELCFGKQVKVVYSSKDRYGRILGTVYIGNKNVNKELLRMGLAWHYIQFNNDKELAKLEQEARNKKIGLWSHPNPIPPWEFRKKR